MKNILLLMLVLQSFASVFAQADKRLEGIDKAIESLMKEYHTVGLSIAIIENGEITYTKGYGYSDLEKGLKTDEHTLFGIGSVTKSFTASAIGILEEEGKLSIMDSPIAHIPELKFHSNTMNESIRIRNMLAHNTGSSAWSTESSSVLFVSDELEDLVPRLSHLEPVANVGEEWIYCNYMYALAGIVIQRVTGESWMNNLDTKLFKPIGMNRTVCEPLVALQQPNRALGYTVLGEELIVELPEWLPTRAPAGSVFSSAIDMAQWIKLWLNEGQLGDKQILPADYMHDAIRPQQIISGGPVAEGATDSKFTNYGYGWFNRDWYGYYKVDHSGGVSGYTSNVAFFPNENFGLIVLTNQSLSSVSMAVTQEIEKRFLGINHPIDTTATKYLEYLPIAPTPESTELNELNLPSHPLDSLSGMFYCAGFGEVEVFLKDEVLYAKLPFTTFRLVHNTHNSFSAQYSEKAATVMTSSWLQFNFVSDFDGNINSFQMNVQSGGADFERIR